MSTDAELRPSFDPTPAAENALAALRLAKLVRSWHPLPDGTYDILIGRGTVQLGTTTAVDVLDLAATLTRDRIRILGRGYPMGYRTTRYQLSDGRFLARHDSRTAHYAEGCPYSVYAPGADVSGSAAISVAARTQIEALALAGLKRVRGRCTRCRHLRPLSHHPGSSWQPDPAIPCPNCQADAGTAVVLLCHTCNQPILRRSDRSSALGAWLHADTNSTFCATAAGNLKFRRPQGRLQ